MLMILWACNQNIYYMGIYNASQLKGDPLKIMCLFGFAEVSGIFVIERIISKVTDTKGLIVSFIMVLIPCLIIKLCPLTPIMLYICFLLEIFSLVIHL